MERSSDSHLNPIEPNNSPRIDMESDSSESMLQSKWTVLAIIFLATGVFGIPLLWVNLRFSTAERVLWSIAATVYSLSMVALFVGFVYWIFRWTIG